MTQRSGSGIRGVVFAFIPIVIFLTLTFTACNEVGTGLPTDEVVGKFNTSSYQGTADSTAEGVSYGDQTSTDSTTEGTSAYDTEDTNGSTTNTEEESISETIISSGITADAILGCSDESVITLTSLNNYFVYTAPVGGRQYKVRTTKINEFLKVMQPCTPDYCPKFSHIVIGADGFVEEEIHLDLEVGVKALLDVNKDKKMDIVVEVTEVFPNKHLRLAVRGNCGFEEEEDATPAEEINEAFETDDDFQVLGKLWDNGCSDFSDPIIWDFKWPYVPNATKYHLYVKGAKAGCPVIDNPNIAVNTYKDISKGSLIYEKHIYGWTWKVRAFVNNSWTDWYVSGTFNVEPPNTDCPYLIKAEGK